MDLVQWQIGPEGLKLSQVLF